jgi:hypothetical protein
MKNDRGVWSTLQNNILIAKLPRLKPTHMTVKLKRLMSLILQAAINYVIRSIQMTVFLGSVASAESDYLR